MFGVPFADPAAWAVQVVWNRGTGIASSMLAGSRVQSAAVLSVAILSAAVLSLGCFKACRRQHVFFASKRQTVNFLGLNRFDRVSSLNRKADRRIAAKAKEPQKRNRVGGGNFVIEPLEDRRMLAVLDLGVNILADISGTPGNPISGSTVNVGDTFYIEITALDQGGASNGLTALSLDIGWDGAALELLNNPFDPVPLNGIVTPNFPLSRGGTLSAGLDSIDELRGLSNPPADGFAIGNGTAQRFALLHFRADAPVTASAFTVALGSNGVAFANGDPLANTVIDPQTITVASATPTFSIGDVTANEGNSGTTEFTFTVTATNLGSVPVSVNFGTSDGFATTADNDYTATNGTLTFTPGLPNASTRTVTVLVNGDTLFEGDETFTVTLSNPSAGSAIGDGTGVGNIDNDDPQGPAAFTISDATIAEGNSGTLDLTFTVTLNNPAATPASVHYSLLPVTASPGDDDYVPLNGTLTFTPGTLGATQQTITIQINGDSKVELTETFQVVLDTPVNAAIADGEGVGTITNDDTATISVADVTIIEGNAGTSQAMVVVTMSNPAVLPITVHLTTSNGSANDTDYVAVSQDVVFGVNQTQVIVPVTINGDTSVEADETITVTLSSPLFNGGVDPTRATIGDGSATITITNDDASPTTAQLSVADVTLAEGDSGATVANVTITLSAAVNEDVTVTINTASDTATVADNDFVAVLNQIATILAGQTSVVVPITINGDAKTELNEQFTVALSNAQIGGVTDPGRVAISDATAAVVITNDDQTTISLNDVSQTEGDSDFDFTITLSKAVDVPLTMTVRSGTTDLFNVTVPAGVTTHQFTVSVANSDDNNIVEGERVAEITLVNLQAQGRNVVLGDVTGEAIVLDNDTATLSINDVTQEEAVGDFVFTLTLTKAVAVDVFVTIQAPEGTDIITIPANALTQTFTVLFDDNDIVEFDGDFDIVITSIDADGLPVTVADNTGVGTILDDDFADITISDVSITEGNNGNKNLVFTVTLSHETDADVVLNYATSDGTATAGSDYVAKSGTITFARPLLITDPFITTQTITIEIIGDTVVEANETFNLTLSGLTAEGLENIAVFLMDATAIGTITDDDTPMPTLNISDGTVVTEGDSGQQNMVFTVTLVNPPTGQVQVNYQTVDGAASSLDLDFVDTFGVLTFAPGTTTQTITVPILGDTLVELDEAFTVELFTATGATIGDDEGTGTITDDDAATISIADAVAVVEGNSGTVTMTFAVTLSNEVDTNVTVTVNTTDGTATGGADFVAITGGTLTFTAGGALSQNITVMVNGDTTVEPDEVLSVVLSAIEAAGRDVTFADATASGTITDDDVLTISVGNATLVEGTGATPTSFLIPVTLSAPASQDITITVNTANGTASAGSDYTAQTNATVTIPAGQTTANITIPVVADSAIEQDETFGVTISNALLGGVADPSVTIATATSTVTIANDDANSMLSIADVSIAEGTAAGTTTMTFTITMSAVQSEAVTVTVNTSNGTATVADGDYTALADFDVTIPAGQTSATFTVTIGRDAKVEANETFMVTLSDPLLDGVAAPGEVSIADGTAIGTITNDDSATVTIANASVTEGNSGTTNMVFTLTLSAAVDAPVTVTLNTADGTATIAGNDYEAITGGTVTFAPGETTKTFNVTVNGDTTVETNETFTLALSDLQAGGRNVTLGTASSATGTITNDDGITVSVADVSVVETNSGTTNMVFTITLSAAVNDTVTVNVSTADVLASAGTDYQGISNLPITFAAGETSKTVTIEIGGDTLVERDETLTVTLSGLTTTVPNVTLGDAVATGTITNDDAATISIANVSITEGNSGTSTMTFTITMSNQVDTAITLEANTANGTATVGSDYVALVDSPISIAANTTMQTISVTINGDTTVEADETLTILLDALQAGGRNVTLADAEAIGTITNNDAATISIAPATQVEGNSGTSTMTFNVTLSAAVDVPVTVTLNTTDGTATIANNDYVAVTGGTLTFNPGDPLTKTFTVTINGDTSIEQNETFNLTMSNVQAGGRNVTLGTAAATGTITNDDGPGTAFLSIGNASITEGNSGTSTLTFTVTLSAAVEDDVTVTVNSANVTATAGTDYVALSNVTVTIPANQTSATVTVTINGDLTVELDETFNLTLSNPLFDGVTNLTRVALDTDNSDNIDNVGVGTITNNDQALLTIANVTQVEGTSATPTAFNFTITMSNPSDRATTVVVNTADGTATVANSDYTAVTGQVVTIAAGATSATVTVNVTADSTVESNETFTVTLSNPLFDGVADTTRIALGTASSATATINDDDGQSTLSGVVYVDANNNGVRDTGEVGVPGVQITLRRTDTTGTADQVILTGNDGTYSFANVGPGTYSIIESQPGAFLDGTDAVGSQGGTLANDSITGIAVTGGVTGTNNNFGERGLLPAFVSKQLYLGSTPAASTALRELNARAAELAGNTSLAQAIRSGGSSVVNATVSISDATLSESNTGTTTMTFNVTLSAASDAAVSVTVNTADGTATTADSDYAALVNQTVTFNPGDPLTKTVTVTLTGDTKVEANETFTVNLSNIQANGRNITIADGSATGTINNDDAATVSINDQTVTEGNTGSANMTFTVTLSAAVDAAVAVTVNTANGTATTADNDYTALTNQTITFTPGGSLTQTVTVAITGDTRVEANETFNVNLSNIQASSRNVTISDGTGLGTITNNDSATISVADVQVVEGNSGTTNLVYTLTMSNAVDTAVTVQASTADGTATAGSDYTAITNQTVTFNAGSTTATVTVLVNGDTVVEPNELLSLNLSNVSAGGRTVTISDGSATGTITNDDTSTTALSIGDVELVEGNNGTTNMVFTVTLVNPPATGDVTVQFTTGGGTATAGTDYTTTTGTLTFPQGTTTRTISVPIVGDTMFEPNETFNVTLSNSTNAVISDPTAVGTITNDDTTTASLSIGPASLIEGNNGTTNMTFTVTLTNPAATGDTTVNFATSNGTATAGTDYTATNGTLTFAQGQTTRTFTVPITGDTTVEPDETFTVTLSNSTNAMIGTATATGTITNDDQAAASLSIGPGTLVEGNSGQANMQFTVTLANPPSSGNVTVQFTTNPGSATAGTDYTTTTGTLTFPQGTTTQTINIPILGDTMVEPDEMFTVTLSNASGATISTGTANGTITNDDQAASLAIAANSRVEGNSGTANLAFTVTLTNPPASGNVTVQFSTGSGTAAAGTDYTTTTGTLTFPQGTTTQTINVPIVGDTDVEADETFVVTLSNPTGAVLGTATATGTITNDDTAPAASLAIVATRALAEGNSGSANMEFTVTLTNPPSTGNVTVQFTTGGGNATAGTDYTTTSGTLTFPQGTTTQTIIVPIIGDNTVELDETFNVTLSNPTSATISTGTSVGTITNDDTSSITFQDETIEGLEAAGDQTFTLVLSKPVDVDITLTFNDEVENQTVTIPAGSTTKTVLAIVDDNDIVQEDLDYAVTLSNLQASGRSVTIGDANATGTILDDDFADVEISNVTLTEGNSGTKNFTFTVTLTNEVEANVSMSVAVAGVTATVGEDFVAPTITTIEFEPGETSKTFTVVVNGDTIVEPNETFSVTLSNLDAEGLEDPSIEAVAFSGGGSTLVATGTITNDDAAAAASIIAFAPAGRGLPGESNYTVGGGGTQAVAHATLDSNAVDEAFAGAVTGSLSAGQESRRQSPADEAFDDTTDWLN